MALLDAIHGVSLEDYAAVAFKLSQGFSDKEIAGALGVDSVLLAEANTLWQKRMEEDETFTVVTQFGQYFATAAEHPKLKTLEKQTGHNPNLERLKTDRYFYEELCGARIAAYEYGLDGAQWILDNYGIELGDFQAVAAEYGKTQQTASSEEIMHFSTYQFEKKDEYAARFAAEQGGNVADDVEF